MQKSKYFIYFIDTLKVVVFIKKKSFMFIQTKLFKRP